MARAAIVDEENPQLSGELFQDSELGPAMKLEHHGLKSPVLFLPTG